MTWIKKYLYIGIAIIIAILITALAIVIDNYSSMENKWKTAMENVKTYSEQLSSSTTKNRALKLTVDQLESSEDSILQELNKTRNELKVKDSKLQSMMYLASKFSKADTIIYRDTIFKDQHFDTDTLLSDEWYSVRVGLKYPSTIAIKPEFKSVKHLVVSSKRETVNPPKKFFLFRWFQKKHTVLNIDVIEQNPYIENQTYRHVEIIK